MKLAPRPNFLSAKHGSLGSPDSDYIVVSRDDWEEARRILFEERADSLIRQVTLSRRNLMYLLSELESGDKSPYIIKPNGPLVAAEPDEVHYKGRQPGQFSPDVERTVREIELCLAVRRTLK